MADDQGEPTADPRDGLASQLRQLEQFIATTESEGGELPPEAVEMVARLREIMQALEGLSSSFEGLNAAAAASTAPAEPPAPKQS